MRETVYKIGRPENEMTNINTVDIWGRKVS